MLKIHTTLLLKSPPGFTLIEILVVVIIVAVLAAIALPQYQKAVEKTQFTQTLAYLQRLYRAEKLHYLQYGSYDSSLKNLEEDWPSGTRLAGNNKFGNITFPTGHNFSFNFNNTTIQSSYKGITLQMSLSTGSVACYHYKDAAKKKICQRVQSAGYTCGINSCTLMRIGH